MGLPNYPNNPLVNQDFALPNGTTMRWDGEKWKALSSADMDLRAQLAIAESQVSVAGLHARYLHKTTNCVKTLGALDKAEGSVCTTRGFLENSLVGGGRYTWVENYSKSAHTGGTVLAPEAITAWNGTQEDLPTLLNWVGFGSGCWVHISDSQVVNPEMFGAVRNNRALDNTPALKACHKHCQSVQYPADAEYTIKQTNVIEYFDGAQINFNGASIYVHPDTTISDAVGTFGRFSNWVYYRSSATELRKGVTITAPNFVCARLAVNGIGGADTRAVRSDHKAAITIVRPVFRGVGEPAGLGGPTPLNDAKHGGLWYGNGYILNIAKPDITLAGNGIIAMGSRRLCIIGGNIGNSGVSEDKTTWANASAILCRDTEYVLIQAVEVSLTGGSSIFCSQDNNYQVRSVNVLDCVLIGAGLSAITSGHRTYAGTPSAIENVTLVGNTIKGFCCAPEGDLHSGVKIALESSDAIGKIRSVELDNNVDFLAPWETYNTTTNSVDGSYNVNKTTGYDVGSQYSTQVSANALGAISHVSVKGTLKNHSRLGLLILKCDYVDLDVSIDNVGFGKKVDLTPWQIQQSLRLTSNTIVRGRVDITRQSQGVVRSDAFCSPVFLSDNQDVQMSITATLLGNQLYTVKLSQTVEGCKTIIDPLSTDTRVTDAGNTYEVDVSSGTYSKTSLTRVLTNTVDIITGGRPISPSVRKVKKSYLDTSGTRAVTLYSAKMYFRKEVEFVGGINGNLTISPLAGDLIDGSGSTITLLPNERVTLYSDGTTWFTV